MVDAKVRFSSCLDIAGYTLIEILVVTLIMSTVVMGGMAAYTRFNQRTKLSEAAETLATQIRQVKKKADAGEMPNSTNCQVLNGYRLTRVDNNTIRVEAICKDRSNNDVAVEEEQDIKLTNEVVFTEPNWEPVTFWVLSEGIDSDQTVVMGIMGGGGNIYRVSITPGGVVVAEKGAQVE